MSEIHRITVSPDQCGGRPCLRGLRMRVKDVLDLLAAGADRAAMLADFPLLEADAQLPPALSRRLVSSGYEAALEPGETLVELV